MRFKAFNARYRLLGPPSKTRCAEERAVEDTHLILQCIEQKCNLKQQQSEVSMSWAFGKRHIFLRFVFFIYFTKHVIFLYLNVSSKTLSFFKLGDFISVIVFIEKFLLLGVKYPFTCQCDL